MPGANLPGLLVEEDLVDHTPFCYGMGRAWCVGSGVDPVGINNFFLSSLP